MYDNTIVINVGDKVKPTYPISDHPPGLVWKVLDEDPCHYEIGHTSIHDSGTGKIEMCSVRVPKRCVYLFP